LKIETGNVEGRRWGSCFVWIRVIVERRSVEVEIVGRLGLRQKEVRVSSRKGTNNKLGYASYLTLFGVCLNVLELEYV